MQDPSQSQDLVVDQFLDQMLQGQAPPLEEFARQHGDLSDEAKRRLQLLVAALGGAALPFLEPISRADEPLPFERLGRYRLIRKIAQGGMGTVFLAEQEPLARLVALKLIRPELSASSVARQRFQREALTIARLKHDNVVTIHDAGEEAGVAYLAMDLVPGKGLHELLAETSQRGERLSLQDAVHYTHDIALALEAAHGVGIIHRDVKPSNVRITPEGRALLLDFGLAQVEDAASLSMTGQFHGTPSYASPEQVAASPVELDARTDVYSLGVVLYECATGARPFRGATTQQIFHQILTREAPLPRRLNPSISRDLETVIITAMEKDRTRRYLSARDFAIDLRHYLCDEPILARRESVASQIRRFARQHRALVGGTVATLLALVLGFIGVSIALARSTDALKKLRRLSDVKRLADMKAEQERLWPAYPDKLDSLRRWLTEAKDLASRLPEHRRSRDELRAKGKAPLAGTSTFDNVEDSWQYSTTAALVNALEAFTNPDAMGGLADVEKRVSIASTIEHKTIEDHEDQWSDAIADLAGSNIYNGLTITPQIGLIPLEPDPESGLWEFLVWQSGERPERDEKTGRWIITGETGIVLVLLPGGTFSMGAQKKDPTGANYDPDAEDDESPVTPVTLKPFFLSKYEMTQGQWLRIMGKNPSYFQNRGEATLSYPVEEVSCADCEQALTRLGLVLPTEAQWEYGARVGTNTPWFTGTDKRGLKKVANVADQYSKTHHGSTSWIYEDWDDGYADDAPVGRLAANAFGLHDVLGNVWEWCRDHRAFYSAPASPGDGERVSAEPGRAVRGGCFSGTAALARCANRCLFLPDYHSPGFGCRPAMALGP